MQGHDSLTMWAAAGIGGVIRILEHQLETGVQPDDKLRQNLAHLTARLVNLQRVANGEKPQPIDITPTWLEKK